MTSVLTPYYLAFPESYTETPFYLDQSINCVFALDMCTQFVSAFYDDDFQIIDSVRVRECFLTTL